MPLLSTRIVPQITTKIILRSSLVELTLGTGWDHKNCEAERNLVYNNKCALIMQFPPLYGPCFDSGYNISNYSTVHVPVSMLSTDFNTPWVSERYRLFHRNLLYDILQGFIMHYIFHTNKTYRD